MAQARETPADDRVQPVGNPEVPRGRSRRRRRACLRRPAAGSSRPRTAGLPSVSASIRRATEPVRRGPPLRRDSVRCRPRRAPRAGGDGRSLPFELGQRRRHRVAAPDLGVPVGAETSSRVPVHPAPPGTRGAAATGRRRRGDRRARERADVRPRHAAGTGRARRTGGSGRLSVVRLARPADRATSRPRARGAPRERAPSPELTRAARPRPESPRRTAAPPPRASRPGRRPTPSSGRRGRAPRRRSAVHAETRREPALAGAGLAGEEHHAPRGRRARARAPRRAAPAPRCARRSRRPRSTRAGAVRGESSAGPAAGPSRGGRGAPAPGSIPSSSTRARRPSRKAASASAWRSSR